MISKDPKTKDRKPSFKLRCDSGSISKYVSQNIGFAIFFNYHAEHLSACAGNQSKKQVRQKMQRWFLLKKRIQRRLRQRDLSQNLKPTAINLLQSEAWCCGIWQGTSFPISNFGCDTKKFLAQQLWIFDFANKQVLRGADAEWRGYPV